jgi:uncharacterized protein (TIGR02145 family)
MKRILILAITLSLAFVSCNDKPAKPEQPIAVESVSLNQNSATLGVGDTLYLVATISPVNADNKTVNWKSTADSVATVTNGIVNTLKSGRTSIVVTTVQGNFTDTAFLIVANGCNFETPGWGASLGTITRGTQIWTIEGNGISQVWSDAVQATNCDKTNFNSGGYHSQRLNADCRSNPGQKGDLFSFCAVIRFQDELCPAPWRVPTEQDFRKLNMALGGQDFILSPGNSHTDEVIRDKYLNDWGGSYGGLSHPEGTLEWQNLFANYWSQSDIPTAGVILNFSVYGAYNMSFSVKYLGYALRCVRDK